MKKKKAMTPAQKQKKYEDSKTKEGLALVRVWVPLKHKEDIKDDAKRYRGE